MEYFHFTIWNFPSKFLERKVRLEIYRPYVSFWPWARFPLLLFNDGQDLTKMQLGHKLETFSKTNKGKKLLVVGICAQERLAEYGTIDLPDYKGRGAKARAYSQFVTKELIPFLRRRYPVSRQRKNTVFAGFSLGGLAAIDIALEYPAIFGGAGVFSGALWWRSKAYIPRHPDANRIIHGKAAEHRFKKNTRFWFQAGTKDENNDRNRNGVIDAIDDTLHLIRALQENPTGRLATMHYEEVEGGTHTIETWREIMPSFLDWMFGKPQAKQAP